MKDDLHEVLRRYKGRTAIVRGGRLVSYESLAVIVDVVSEKLKSLEGERVNLVAVDVASLVVGLAALSKSTVNEFAVVPRDLSDLHQFRANDAVLSITDSGRHSELKQCLPTEDRLREKSDARRIVLFTSGTSGIPREVRHNWYSLTRTIRFRPAEFQRRWSCGFAFGTFAHIQVVLQALLSGDLYCEPVSNEPQQVAEYFGEMAVDCCAATTSFWRQLLRHVSRDVLTPVPLRQITLGGEIVDQLLFDDLKNVFPDARVTQVYATTELGVCFSVSDNRVGFPLNYLQNQLPECALRIGRQETLEVRLHRRTQELEPDCQGDVWVDTGDLVRIEGDRVYFVGRRSEVINVGGTKVSPCDVEHLIRRIDGVADVRVYAIRSSLVGSVVGAIVLPVVESGEPSLLREEIVRVCRRNLPKSAVPARLEFVAEIPQTWAYKAARNGSQESIS